MTQLYTRDQWGALPLGPTGICKPEKIIVHHTTGATLGRDQSDDWVRQIDRQHKYGNGWAGIAYSWLFDTYGNIFEGRGWDKAGAHTVGWNSRAHAFAYMGDGDKVLTEDALDALRWLVREHDNRYGERPIEAHRDLNSTHCPGNWLYLHKDVRGRQTVAPVMPGANVPTESTKIVAVDGAFGPATVRALQASLNETGADPRLAVDGIYGPGTKRALQARLNHVMGPLTIDGVVGPNTVRVLQRYVGAAADGSWGPETTRLLQRALNKGSF